MFDANPFTRFEIMNIVHLIASGFAGVFTFAFRALEIRTAIVINEFHLIIMRFHCLWYCGPGCPGPGYYWLYLATIFSHLSAKAV